MLCTKTQESRFIRFNETEKLKDIVFTVIRDYLVVSHIIQPFWSSANKVCEKVKFVPVFGIFSVFK